MKQKAILLIALLMLVSMIIIPVNAYTLVETITATGTTTDYEFDPMNINLQNISFGKTITHIVFTGTAYISNTHPSGSYTSYIWLGATKVGNFTATWTSGTNYQNYTNPFTITYDILDLTTTATGPQTLRLNNNSQYWEFGQYIGTIYTYTGADTQWTRVTSGYGAINAIAGGHYPVGVTRIYTGSAVTTPVASFSCVPTSQYLSTDVVCTDTSTNTPTSWLWTIDYPALGIMGWQTSTSQNFSWQSAYAGVFSVNLQATNGGGSDWENKTNYVTISTAGPTVTPTPVPTIPAGYVRNNLYVWDQNDAQIVGADVDVLDVEAGTWTNTSADADGWITIDTLPYHTVNVYAHYPTSNIYLPNEILGLETGYYGGHNWVLVLYPYTTTPAGFVTLYINTRDYDSKTVLVHVNLQIKNLVTGAVTGESTGSTDSVQTVVTNATNYQITGSKSGYLSKTIVINSGEASSKTVVVELSKATVTPTVTGTPLPGEITVRPSYSPGCDPSAYDAAICNTGKDADMMNQIRDAGPGLIGLAIIATIIGLIKLMTKK